MRTTASKTSPPHIRVRLKNVSAFPESLPHQKRGDSKVSIRSCLTKVYPTMFHIKQMRLVSKVCHASRFSLLLLLQTPNQQATHQPSADEPESSVVEEIPSQARTPSPKVAEEEQGAGVAELGQVEINLPESEGVDGEQSVGVSIRQWNGTGWGVAC